MTSRRALGLLTAGVLGFQVNAAALADDQIETAEAEAEKPVAKPAAPAEKPVAPAANPAAAKPAAAKPATPKAAAKRSTDEPLIDGDGAVADYLRAVHHKVHARWSDNFLPMAQAQLPKTHPVNEPSRRVVLKVAIARNGDFVSAEVKEPSGAPDFDTTAVDVLRDARSFVPAPEEALSDDGNAHLVWAFARDHRRCSDVASTIVESPLDVAMVRLVEQKREAAALKRLASTPAAARDPGITAFARAYLKRALVAPDSKVAFAAAVALANAGDATGADMLRAAVQKGENVVVAARALSRSRIAICPLVKDRLTKGNAEAKGAALAALRWGTTPECIPALSELAANRGAPVAQRLAALEALGTVDDPAIRKSLIELSEEGPAAIRAAAMLASARGGGRPALFRLTPKLRDPSVEIRTAASAGIIRAVGDAALDQLYLLFKETDPRPYEAVAAQLTTLQSAASAELLARYFRKDDKRIRLAAAAALAARDDEHARKALVNALKDASAEVVLYASSTMSPQERTAVIAAAGASARNAYRSMAVGNARPAASDWLLGKFTALDGTAKAEVLGEWISGRSAGTLASAQPPR